jgi:hypothetical protein
MSVHNLGKLIKELHVKKNSMCLVLSGTTPLRNMLAHRTQAHLPRWFFLEMVNRIELPYRAMDLFRYVFSAGIARELDHRDIAPSVTCQVSLVKLKTPPASWRECSALRQCFAATVRNAAIF